MAKIDRIAATIAILNCMASAEDSLGVTEIARKLDMNKVSVHRVLTSLEASGWVSQDQQTHEYRFDSEIYQFSLLTASNMAIQKMSLGYLYELSHMTGESAQLSLRVGTQRIFAQDISGSKESRLRVPMGLRLPLWVGATGRSMLAFLSDSEIDEVIRSMQHDPVGMDDSKSIPEEELRTHLEKIRKDGYAISAGELQPDICSIAAPIIDGTSLVIGAISVRGLLPRFGVQNAEIYSSALIDRASKIRRDLSERNQRAPFSWVHSSTC